MVEGHKLAVEDLQKVLKAEPTGVFVGIGYVGLMKVRKERATFRQAARAHVH